MPSVSSATRPSGATSRLAPSSDSDPLTGDGVLAWAFSLDHKRIATMQLMAIAVALAVGGVAGVLLQVEHLTPADLSFGQGTYARSFTLHGIVMVFLVLVPSISGTLGLFRLPLQIGASNVAFPRLALTSLQLWGVGALLLALSLLLGGAESGWTLAVPLSTRSDSATSFVMAAVLVLAAAAMLRGLVVITTLHLLRAKGVTWRRTTPFGWGLYAQSIVTLVAAPVMGLTMLMLMGERSVGMGVFDPELGGDPLLFQHFFWLPAQALAYATILPAFGLVTDVLRELGRSVSRRSALVGIAAFAVLSLLSWGSHMPTSGHGAIATTFFSLMALAMILPAWLLLRSWLISQARGVVFGVPGILALGFVGIFLLGGVGAPALAAPSIASHLHGTLFVVGHAHLMFGAVLLALLCGLHHWWFGMTGVGFAEAPARWGSALLLAGLPVTHLPQLLAGARGMLRRVVVYPPEHGPLQMVSFVGTLLVAAGLVLLLTNLVRSLQLRVREPTSGDRS